MKKHVLASGFVLAALAAPAFAEGHGFVRGEIGRSDVNIGVDDFGSASDEDTSWGVRGGYWFNANFAVEGFYNQYYSQTVDDGFYDYRLKLHGVGVGVVAKKNFGGEHRGFFIGGRAGVARGVATVEYDDDDIDGEASSARPYFGVNVGYDINEKVGVSLNWDRQKASEDGVSVTAKTLTLGVEARF
ncbi:MAG TPA: outer membrane beta-barrel protein [Lysobacter sp.]|nr:outer membrane beta-barrel protein [Lysobacter sp.]